MLLAKVTGNVISTEKQDCYDGHKLMIVKALGLDGKTYGDDIVVTDGVDVGSGIGDIVIVVQEGGSARDVIRSKYELAPIEMSIMAIVDEVESDSGSIYQFGRR